jgi:hypothetical protein
MAHAVPLVFEGAWEGDEISPAVIFAVILTPGMYGERGPPRRIALAVARIGEDDR